MATGNFAFMDTCSHINGDGGGLRAAAKWIQADAVDDRGFLSHRSGAWKEERCYKLGSLSTLQTAILPGYNTVYFGCAWKTDVFGGAPLVVSTAHFSIHLFLLPSGFFQFQIQGGSGGASVEARLGSRFILSDVVNDAHPVSAVSGSGVIRNQWFYIEGKFSTGVGPFLSIQHQPPGGGTFATFVTAIYANSAEFLGLKKQGTFTPMVLWTNADGDFTDGIPTENRLTHPGGAHYLMTKENRATANPCPDNTDTTINLQNINDQEDENLDNISVNAPILCMQAVWTVSKNKPGPMAFEGIINDKVNNNRFAAPIYDGAVYLDGHNNPWTARYPSYSFKHQDFSRMERWGSLINPATALPWTIQEINQLQLGERRIMPEPCAASGSIFSGGTYGGGIATYATGGPQTSISVGCRFRYDGGSLWVGAESFVFSGGDRSIAIRSDNGLLHLQVGDISLGIAESPLAQKHITLNHEYHLEIYGFVDGDVIDDLPSGWQHTWRINANARLNGETLFPHTLRVTNTTFIPNFTGLPRPLPFSFNYGFLLLPGFGNTTVVDYVSIGGSNPCGDVNPDDPTVTDPLSLECTQMVLEVATGAELPGKWRVYEA